MALIEHILIEAGKEVSKEVTKQGATTVLLNTVNTGAAVVSTVATGVVAVLATPIIGPALLMGGTLCLIGKLKELKDS
jgi:hypothetical protein